METQQAVAAKLAGLDTSLFEAAFSNGDTELLNSLLAEDFEFYHDRDGLSYTSATAFVADVSRDYETGAAGGKRVLVPGSLTTHMIGDFGAMQKGQHEFHELVSDGPSIPREKGSFIHMWKRSSVNPHGWQLTRIISYDHEGM